MSNYWPNDPPPPEPRVTKYWPAVMWFSERKGFDFIYTLSSSHHGTYRRKGWPTYEQALRAAIQWAKEPIEDDPSRLTSSRLRAGAMISMRIPNFIYRVICSKDPPRINDDIKSVIRLIPLYEGENEAQLLDGVKHERQHTGEVVCCYVR